MGSDSGSLSPDDASPLKEAFLDEVNEEEEVTLPSIENSHTINFPLKSSYTKWKGAEAFRELVQNWRDGIIRSFALHEGQFKVVREDRSQGHMKDIIYTVPNPVASVPNCLGYIRYYGRNNRGTVDITNRKAMLEPHHLDLGGSSKTDQGDQAGAHGEGLKIALLVLQRCPQNNSVHCLASGFTWNFDFTTAGKLVAHLRRLSPEQVTQEKEKSQETFKQGGFPFAPSPTRDVQFIIGAAKAGRDENGKLTRRKLVPFTVFDEWCQTALFLQELKDGDGIVRTYQGDLITHEKFRQSLYMKGLLLSKSLGHSSASLSGKPLKFGYNFQDGTTNRERQSVSGAREECEAILNFWDRVIATKPEYVEELHNLLLSESHSGRWADVAMAKDVIKSQTAVRLKERLVSHASNWYYSLQEQYKNPRVQNIIQGLGRTAVMLPTVYWSILERWSLVRTAEEEQKRRFLRADTATIPQSSFANETERLLRACLSGCIQTVSVRFEFVKAGQLSLDTYCSPGESLFKTHDRWLAKDESIKELGLPEDSVETDVVFHVVKRLFSSILGNSSVDQSSHDRERMKRLICAEQRLLEYNQFKKSFLISPQVSCSLKLEWNVAGVSDSGFLQKTDEPVTRSMIGCIAVNGPANLPAMNQSSDDDYETYRCREVTCSPSSGKHILIGLHPYGEYFVVAFKASDPHSIALVSDSCTPGAYVPFVSPVVKTEPSYTLGVPLTQLDLLEPRAWHQAKETSTVIIGISKDDAAATSSQTTPVKSALSTKRRRVNLL